MAAPAAIDKAMTLKTMRFEPELVLGFEGDKVITFPAGLDRAHLFFGVGSGSETRGMVSFDQTRRTVRQALREAISIARAIDAPTGDHRVICERIRAFASRYGTLWNTPIPNPMPLALDDRKIDGSLLQWYRELLTLLDLYEMVPVAAGRREDRTLHERVQYVQDGATAAFVSRSREAFRLGRRDSAITVQPPWEAKPQVVDSWQLIHGKSTSLAWAILTAVCKAKLDGRIDIGLHPSERNSLAITPSGILPTLFARLWLDCLHREADATMVRLCQRPGCERRIPDRARADALYCGATCQKADRRRLRRLAVDGA